MNAEPIADAPPLSDHLNDYDRSHFRTYLRLLDAAAETPTDARSRLSCWASTPATIPSGRAAFTPRISTGRSG